MNTPTIATSIAAALIVVSAPASAATKLCGDREQILQRLAQKHEETQQSIGLSADGGVIEVLVSPTGGWTMMVTYPKKPTCILAVGEAWQTFAALKGETS